MTDSSWQSWQNRLLVGVMGFIVRRQRRNKPSPGYRGVRRALERTGERLRPAKDVRWSAVDVGGVPGEWVEAPGARPGHALLYLHGGGYVSGSPVSHRYLTGELSRHSAARVLAIDYRLAPEHVFPAALDDAVAAYTWLLGQGISANKLAIGGDSAGGGLTVATLLSARERGLPQPAAAICLSPWVDLEGAGETIKTHAHLDPMLTPIGIPIFARYYVGEAGDVRHPLVSPIHADLKELAPMLVQVGGREVLLDDARRLVARIQAAGGRAELEVWDHMIHVWQIFGFLPEARRAVARLGTFLRRHMDLPE
ncbi:MAG: alpha/beta hydrolase [Myxococcales bacterium]|nr:alpha/beta hydrolase [Myxococcales bacterium]